MDTSERQGAEKANRERREKTRKGKMAELLYKDESYAIMGACFEIYREKGCGFVEPVYQECLEMELQDRGIPFVPQQSIKIDYKGRELKHPYAADIICYGKIILELKAVSTLIDEHRAQLHNYLKATGRQLGLLINFGHHPKLQYERIAMTNKAGIRTHTQEDARTRVRQNLSQLSRI